MKPLPISILAIISAPLGLLALEVTVESFRDGNIPTGYIVINQGMTADNLIKVSEPPYIDYLIPNNSGAPGITAQKEGGQYIVDSTVAELTGGANSLSGVPDIYHVAFEWSDGSPLPFGSEHYGVSWGGWSANETVNLITRINLASTQPLRIFHWFNDGWNYFNHSLDGHNLTITHFDSGGNIVEYFEAVLPSGGAEELFGDHRQFYTVIIDVQAISDGEFLLVQQAAGNIGYKGTAVAIREGGLPDPVLQYTPGAWSDDPILGQLYGYGDKWIYSPALGVIYDAYPWLFLQQTGWVADFGLAMNLANGIFLYSAAHGVIWTSADSIGQYYLFDEARWVPFQ